MSNAQLLSQVKVAAQSWTAQQTFTELKETAYSLTGTIIVSKVGSYTGNGSSQTINCRDSSNAIFG